MRRVRNMAAEYQHSNLGGWRGGLDACGAGVCGRFLTRQATRTLLTLLQIDCPLLWVHSLSYGSGGSSIIGAVLGRDHLAETVKPQEPGAVVSTVRNTTSFLCLRQRGKGVQPRPALPALHTAYLDGIATEEALVAAKALCLCRDLVCLRTEARH